MSAAKRPVDDALPDQEASVLHQIIYTADGSPTIFAHQFQDHYHSRHGALQESQYVFIDQGLTRKAEAGGIVSILEMGFGTGLNLMLTFEFALNRPDLMISYHTLEAYPLPLGLVDQLDLGSSDRNQLLRQFHLAEWHLPHHIAACLIFTKYRIKFEDLSLPQRFDLVYYDAFAPRVQPELWTVEMLHVVAAHMNRGGVLVTYCSQGAFRRNLIATGFHVERLPGPPGKREMLRATLI